MKIFLLILMIGAIGLFCYEVVAFAIDMRKKIKAKKLAKQNKQIENSADKTARREK